MLWIVIKVIPIYIAAFIAPLFYATWRIRDIPQQLGLAVLCMGVVAYSFAIGMKAYRADRMARFVGYSIVPLLIMILGAVITSILPI